MAASIKLSDELVTEARRESVVFNRSIAGQVEHWARLGQAFESAPGFGLERVRAALKGDFNLDDLSDDEQRMFYDLLDDSFDTPTKESDAFFAQLKAEGGGVGMDDDGRLVRGLPGGGVEVIG